MQSMREVRRAALQSQKQMKDTTSKARRLTREMLVYWKRFEKVEKDHRKRVEKEALEKRKMDLELSEVRQSEVHSYNTCNPGLGICCFLLLLAVL